MSRSDVIVIGAGVNGLATAALLARSGRKVILVERRERVGGVCAPREFHPGFTVPGLFHDTTRVDAALVSSLGLSGHGLKRAPREDCLLSDGRGGAITLSADASATASSISRRSETSAERYTAWRSWLDKVAPVVRKVIDEPPLALDAPLRKLAWPTLKLGRALRKLGRRDMMEFLRVPPMCLADWLREWFDDDLLCAGLAFPSLEGAWAGPWSAGTAANLLFRETTRGDAVVGGPAAFSAALQSCAAAAGVDIRTGSGVTAIRVHDGAVAGATLDDGSSLQASTIVSALDPRTTFLDLLPPMALDPRVADDIVNWRCRGSIAKVHLAVSGDAPITRDGTAFAAARIAPTIDDVERAYDALKYRETSATPVVDVRVPSIANPALAPGGHHVLSVIVGFTPDADAGVDADTMRTQVLDRTVERLTSVVPDLRDRIVGQETLIPADFATEYGLSGGHLLHGETALDQLVMRPSLACRGHASPIGGLFLCGPGTHPGTAPTGTSARFAARAAKV